MDAFTSSSRIGLDVWAWWVLGAWVSDGIGWGAHVSLCGPRRCLALIDPFQGKLGVPSGLQPEEVRGSS